MKYILLIVLLILSNLSLSAYSKAGKYHVKTDTIKFKLNNHNNICITAILNKKDTLSLMFHTDINSVSLNPETSKTIRELKEQNMSEATSWTGTEDVAFIEDNSLEISTLKWQDLTVWLDMLTGPETDGKFGPNLFENKIIEINYDQNCIVLHKYKDLIIDSTRYKTFNFKTNEHNSLIVEGTLTLNNTFVNNKFILHSGYGGTIILDNNFLQQNKALNSLAIIEEKALKDSFGNEIMTKKVMLQHFEMFNNTFENLPVSYFDSELEIQKTSVIGGELLKRFNLIIDRENKIIHISENKNTNTPFKTT